ncbi:MAG: hypothetical protein HY263_01175 [Chloroflexi bacterium]|nr:hypothetical protein [Chloroflexota bacterium]
MPIYDYSCSNCGKVTEVIHGINDAGPRFCPECGAEGTMRKALSAPAVLFKGSGWAKVDRRSSGGGRSSGGSKSRSSEGSTSGKAGDGAATGDASTKKEPAGGSAAGGPGSD